MKGIGAGAITVIILAFIGACAVVAWIIPG